MPQLEAPDELAEAPLLRSLHGTDPFVVPDGFFDRFPHTVQQRALVDRRTRSSSWLSFRPAPRIGLILGSVTVLVVALIAWVRWPASTETATTTDTHWTSEELWHRGYDVELLYTELDPDPALMEMVVLPEDDEVTLAYLDDQNLPLDLLIEQP